jgi:hypothetical protein
VDERALGRFEGDVYLVSPDCLDDAQAEGGVSDKLVHLKSRLRAVRPRGRCSASLDLGSEANDDAGRTGCAACGRWC